MSDVTPEPQPTPSGTSRGRVAVFGVAAAVAVAAVVVALLVGRSGDDATTTTTRPPSTTTTAPVPWVATQAHIATARGEQVIVHSAPPDGWDAMTPVQTWDNPAPPSSQASMPARPALPRDDLPLQGRYTDPVGWRFTNPTSFGDPFVMLVTERRGDWLKVEIPVRPNGTDGYVLANDVDMSTTDFHLDLRLGTRTLTLYEGDRVVLSTQVVIGKPATRTPLGRFYVTDHVEQSDPAGFYGPVALPLNAYSEQLDEFDDGVPVIAMHGTNQPQLVGQDASNGCIRVPNAEITKIAELVPAGTPIDISA